MRKDAHSDLRFNELRLLAIIDWEEAQARRGGSIVGSVANDERDLRAEALVIVNVRNDAASEGIAKFA